MREISLKYVLVAVLLSTVGIQSAVALSTVTDVTRRNIAGQPLAIRVESEVYRDDIVAFRIYVAPGKREISPHRAGRFEVAGEDLELRKDVIDATPQPLIWCEVHERDDDGVLEYSFGLPKDMLPRASFTFRNYEPHGMPAFDGYRVLLEEFAPGS